MSGPDSDRNAPCPRWEMTATHHQVEFEASIWGSIESPSQVDLLGKSSIEVNGR